MIQLATCFLRFLNMQFYKMDVVKLFETNTIHKYS